MLIACEKGALERGSPSPPPTIGGEIYSSWFEVAPHTRLSVSTIVIRFTTFNTHCRRARKEDELTHEFAIENIVSFVWMS
jgi:hypothetical protein